MLGLPAYLWRLIPANPILLRVVEGGGKRVRDFIIRSAYLGLLILVVLFSLLSDSQSANSGASLSALAKVSAQLFQNLSYLQLILVALLAPIFTASAITQERDSQTFDILLSTPLTNGQIVLGSMLSRLYFVFALLLSGLPVFSITQIFGGVSISSIVASVLIAASTALVCGALAVGLAAVKVGNRRTIFGFYFFLIGYLAVLYYLDSAKSLRPVDVSGNVLNVSYFTAFQPFLALRILFGESAYQPPELASLPASLRVWPVGWMLSSPVSFYVVFMSVVSLVLVMPAMVLLRKLAQSSFTPIGWLATKLKLARGDKSRPARHVWHNPIAWREAKTRGSTTRPTLLRYAAMALGIIAAMVVVILYAQEKPVAQFVSSSSYLEAERTFTVFSADSATNYRIASGFQVVVNQESVSASRLSGRYEVVSISLKPVPGGAVGGGVQELSSISLRPMPRVLQASQARGLILGLLVLELTVILLILSNASAATVTKEKEDGSLDLLLSTPITSRFYIWGKLRGLVMLAIPMLAVPMCTVATAVGVDVFLKLLGNSEPWLVLPESLLILGPQWVIVCAICVLLGMHMSLRLRTTIQAILATLGIMLVTVGGTGWCGVQVTQGTTIVGLIFGAFSPFSVMALQIDPESYGGRFFADEPFTARWAVVIVSLFACGVYATITYFMVQSMVTNFDMTIRKQAR